MMEKNHYLHGSIILTCVFDGGALVVTHVSSWWRWLGASQELLAREPPYEKEEEHFGGGFVTT